MDAHFIHYNIRLEKVQENIEFIREFGKTLTRPRNGANYRCYLLGENLFVHVVENISIDAFMELPSAQRFFDFQKTMSIEPEIINSAQRIS